MRDANNSFVVIFPDGYDAYVEHEHYCKGFLGDVFVRFSDGTQYELFFIDITRLQQDLHSRTERGNKFFAQPNMIVLTEITTDNIKNAVTELVKQEFFSTLGPEIDQVEP